MSRFTRSLSFVLTVAIAAGSMSYELCSAVGDEDGDAHSLRHSHGDYAHLHHHHHNDASDGGEHDDNHDGFDHLPIDLKAVWSAPRSQQTEAPPVFPPAYCIMPAIDDCPVAECHGIPPPLVDPPDPTRQLRQIRSIVLLV